MHQASGGGCCSRLPDFLCWRETADSEPSEPGLRQQEAGVLIQAGSWESYNSDVLAISYKDRVNFLPITVSYGFAGAFLSVTHAWASYLLNAIGILSWLLVGTLRLYDKNNTLFSTAVGLVFMLHILRSVLLCCPLSGALLLLLIHCCTCSGPP